MDSTTPTPTFDSLGQEAFVRLIRAGDTLTLEAEKFFGRYGLTPGQYDVLRVLYVADAPRTCSQIGERLIHRAPDVTRLIDRLVERGLVERRRDRIDRRRIYVELTAVGRRLMKQIDGPLAKFEQQRFAALTDSELKALSAILTKLSDLQGDAGD